MHSNSYFQRWICNKEYWVLPFIGHTKDNRINFTVSTLCEERRSTSMLQSLSLTFLCEVGRKLNCLKLEEKSLTMKRNMCGDSRGHASTDVSEALTMWVPLMVTGAVPLPFFMSSEPLLFSNLKISNFPWHLKLVFYRMAPQQLFLKS